MEVPPIGDLSLGQGGAEPASSSTVDQTQNSGAGGGAEVAAGAGADSAESLGLPTEFGSSKKEPAPPKELTQEQQDKILTQAGSNGCPSVVPVPDSFSEQSCIRPFVIADRGRGERREGRGDIKEREDITEAG
jgi:hypothetical protein